MRAAVLNRPGARVRVENVELAEPQRGEVQVRIEAAGVCHSDLHYMNGDLRGKLPVVLGHEGVGIVETAGDEVSAVAPGDRVVLTWRPRCGECEFCTSGRPALCVLGQVQSTTGGLPSGSSRLSLNGKKLHHLMGVSCFAERCVVSDRSVVKIPHDVPAEVAAIVGCAVITGVGAALNVMNAAGGEPAVVIGAGGVGLSTVMGLRLVGANPIIVVDKVDSRLNLARELGAQHTVNPEHEDLTSALERIASGTTKWAVDAVGTPATMTQAIRSIGRGGTFVALGLSSADATFPVPINTLVQQEKRIIGSIYGSSNPALQIAQILQLYQSDRLPLNELVGGSFALDDVNAAYQSLASEAVGRSIIVPKPINTSYPGRAPRLADSLSAASETRSA